MVKGVSLYFDILPPTGMILNGYEAWYELVETLSNATTTDTLSFSDDRTSIQVRLQTDTWKGSRYRLRVFVKDLSDGFIQIADEMEISLKP